MSLKQNNAFFPETECVSSQLHSSAAYRKMSSQIYELEEPNIPTCFMYYKNHVDLLLRTNTVRPSETPATNKFLSDLVPAGQES
jgi:hypothetical protein